jgi:hypothetical protein
VVLVIDVVTDLLGEVVEIYRGHDYNTDAFAYSLRGRGTVRAVYVAEKHLHVLVEHNLGFDSATYTDRARDGGFEIYALHEGRVRVVQRCARCGDWAQNNLLSPLEETTWVHKSGEGCKKVGHGG